MQPASTAYPIQQFTSHQQPIYPTNQTGHVTTHFGYAAQSNAAYPTVQHQSPYPVSYPSGLQQPLAPYPTGQPPPVPYLSATTAPQTQGEPGKPSELYSDAPPAYSDVVNYSGPSAVHPPQ